MTMAASQIQPEITMDESPERDRLISAIFALDPVERVILGLRYVEGLKPDQIADLLGAPEEEVRAVLYDAVDQVRLSAAA